MRGNKFRAGERVAVYNTGGRFTGTIHTVDKQYIYVDFDGGGKSISIHHMQCRRLMPKKENLGDEIWVKQIPPTDRWNKPKICLLEARAVDTDGWIKYKRCK